MAKIDPMAAIRTGYIYVADESGAEIPGSRRSTGNCRTIEDYRRLWRELELQAGEDCTVQHSEAGKPVHAPSESKWKDRLLVGLAITFFAMHLLNPPALF